MHIVRGRFGAELGSVSASRAFARSALAGHVPQATIDAAVLVISELATNALLHAGSAFEVTVEAGGTVRLAVADDSPVPPVVRRGLSSEATSGRGMWMIEKLADRWGVEPADGGKRVWCELTPGGGG